MVSRNTMRVSYANEHMLMRRLKYGELNYSHNYSSLDMKIMIGGNGAAIKIA